VDERDYHTERPEEKLVENCCSKVCLLVQFSALGRKSVQSDSGMTLQL
jgi:hypothetical protein